MERLAALPRDWSAGPATAGVSAGRSALFHAGWLVQAQLGMSLSWTWFGGLGGVALWWLLLALFSQPRLASFTPANLGKAAWVAAGGLALAMGPAPEPLRWLGWLCATLGWAWLCSRLQPGLNAWERKGPLSALHWLGAVAGLLAAVWLAAHPTDWQAHWPLLCGLLLLAPLLQSQKASSCPSAHRLDLPMGLMMGSLLPMAEACSRLGWSATTSVTLHLLAMVLGVAGATVLHAAAPLATHTALALPLRRALMAWGLAALLCTWDSSLAMLAVAALSSAASTWAAKHTRNPGATAVAGVALLLMLGHLSVSAGPDALRWLLMPALGLTLLRHWSVLKKPVMAPA